MRWKRDHLLRGFHRLAAWCDLRVAATNAVFGVFCRRWGGNYWRFCFHLFVSSVSISVPLIDGGTVRLPLLVGQSRAMDMILTGRSVSAGEAFEWGSRMFYFLLVLLLKPEHEQVLSIGSANQAEHSTWLLHSPWRFQIILRF